MTLERELVEAVGAGHVEPLDGGSWRVTPGSAAEVAEVIRRSRAHRAATHPVGAGARPSRPARPGAGAELNTTTGPRSTAASAGEPVMRRPTSASKPSRVVAR